MWSGAFRAAWGEHRRAELERHLRGYLVLPIDAAVALEWGRLTARCLALGRPKRDNDLWVAATARRHAIAVVTLDHDFDDIPGLRLVGANGVEVTVPA